MDHSTIAAIATPPGAGGIGVVKISGRDALSIARAIFRRSGSSSMGPREDVVNAFCTHRLYHGHIVDGETGNVLDEVLLAVMYAPHSYTREDVVEIQAHSGLVALRAILDVVLSNGARLAEAGEFTKKLFFEQIIVAQKKERIRLCLSIEHSKQDLDYCLDKFESIGKELEILNQ